jgi:hypothetical protein
MMAESIRARHERWYTLPYGLWTCADGSEVLFNRRYQPIWQRAQGHQPAVPVEPSWITFQQQAWFYNDGDVFHDRAGRLRTRLRAILRDFCAGVDVRDRLQ